MVHAALDAGVTLIDTADAYSRDEAEFGHNEELVAAALRSYGRAERPRGDQGRAHPARARLGARRLAGLPAPGVRGLAAAAAASTRSGSTSSTGPTRRRRGRSRWARCASLFDDGLVRMVGISNADIGRRSTRPARSSATRFVSVQNQFSPGYRSSADELEHCAAHGLAWLPWSPFGGVSARRLAGRDGARRSPRWPTSSGVSVYQVTLAWHLAQADVVVPIPGASRPSRSSDSAAAADLELTADQLARLNTAS